MSRSKSSTPPDFEAALRELEEIVSQIEAGQLGLEEGLSKHQRGNYLIEHCRKVLRQAEQQIDTLMRPDHPGEDRSDEPDNP